MNNWLSLVNRWRSSSHSLQRIPKTLEKIFEFRERKSDRLMLRHSVILPRRIPLQCNVDLKNSFGFLRREKRRLMEISWCSRKLHRNSSSFDLIEEQSFPLIIEQTKKQWRRICLIISRHSEQTKAFVDVSIVVVTRQIQFIERTKSTKEKNHFYSWRDNAHRIPWRFDRIVKRNFFLFIIPIHRHKEKT